MSSHVAVRQSPESPDDPEDEIVLNLRYVSTAGRWGDTVTLVQMRGGATLYLAMPYAEFRDMLMRELYQVDP